MAAAKKNKATLTREQELLWESALEQAALTIAPIGDSESPLLVSLLSVSYMESAQGAVEGFLFKNAKEAIQKLRPMVEAFEIGSLDPGWLGSGASKGMSSTSKAMSSMWVKHENEELAYLNISPACSADLEHLAVRFALSFVIFMDKDEDGATRRRVSEVSKELGDLAQKLGAAGPARVSQRQDGRIIESDITAPLRSMAQAQELETVAKRAEESGPRVKLRV